MKLFGITVVGVLLTIMLCAIPASAQGFSDGFEEKNVNPWWSTYVLRAANPSTSTEYQNSGNQSLKLSNIDGGLAASNVKHSFTGLQSGQLSVWLYDTDPGFKTRQATLSAGSQDLIMFDLGIKDSLENDYNVSAMIAEGSWENKKVNPRTAGWHYLEAEATSTYFKGYIDGNLILFREGDYRFDWIQLGVSGPSWRPSGEYYFDDFAFTANPVPEPAGLVVLGSGLIGLIGIARRKNKTL